MKVFNYLKDHIPYQILKIILSILKNHETVVDNPLIKIYVNKIENRIESKIKSIYYLKLLTLKTVTLFQNIKSNMVKMYLI